MKYIVEKGIKPIEIKNFRKEFKLTQKDLANLLSVSKKTVEKWETSEKEITGPAVTIITLIRNNPNLLEYLSIDEKKDSRIRFYYMSGSFVSTIIDVDYVKRIVSFKNYTNDINARAFGSRTMVSFDDFESFLESRCFPKDRDKMKIELNSLEIPYYDPLMIIEKTQGRVEGDNYWLKKEDEKWLK